jgi:hypothetical protein
MASTEDVESWKSSATTLTKKKKLNNWENRNFSYTSQKATQVAWNNKKDKELQETRCEHPRRQDVSIHAAEAELNRRWSHDTEVDKNYLAKLTHELLKGSMELENFWESQIQQ